SLDDRPRARERRGRTAGPAGGGARQGRCVRTGLGRLLACRCRQGTGGWRRSGWVRVWLGQPELAIEHLARAMRLSPLDPIMPGFQTALAVAHFLAGHYDDASSWATRAGRMGPYFLRTA